MNGLTMIDEGDIQQAATLDDAAALLTLHDVPFVAAAYASLLRRQADPEGLAHYVSTLRTGRSKVDILMAIANSPEGRSKAVRIRGLDRLVRRHRLARLPLVGLFVRLGGHVESNSVAQRRLRAIEQAVYRQQRSIERLSALMSSGGALTGGSVPLAQGVSSGASGVSDELLVQLLNQPPSIISRFIRLRKAPADDVIAQLAELARNSMEAEKLSLRS